MRIIIESGKVHYAHSEYTLTKYGVANFLNRLARKGIPKDELSRKNLSRISRLCESGRLI